MLVLKSRNLWSELKGRNCYMETDSISLLVIYLHCVLQYIQGPTLLLLWPLGQTPPGRWQEPPEHHSLPQPVRGSQILESFWTQSCTFTIFFNLHFIQIITLHEISLKTNCTLLTSTLSQWSCEIHLYCFSSVYMYNITKPCKFYI